MIDAMHLHPPSYAQTENWTTLFFHLGKHNNGVRRVRSRDPQCTIQVDLTEYNHTPAQPHLQALELRNPTV